MKLSLMAMTKNGSWRLERMLLSVKGQVAEIVIGVDTSTTDDTEQRARRYTSQVLRIDNPQGYIEPHIRTLFERCTGDWVLRLDDDELMAANFSLESIPADVLGDYELVGFPRAWIVQRDPLLYIGTGKRPIELVPQFRLMKRDANWSFLSQIHTPGFEMKPAYVVHNVFIYHLNLLDQHAEERRRKYDFYQAHRDATWNRTYLLDPVEVAAGGALPVTEEMFPPRELLCSTAGDFVGRMM